MQEGPVRSHDHSRAKSNTQSSKATGSSRLMGQDAMTVSEAVAWADTPQGCMLSQGMRAIPKHAHGVYMYKSLALTLQQ